MNVDDIAGGNGPPKDVVEDIGNGKSNQPAQADKDQDGDQQMGMQKPDVEEKNMIAEDPQKNGEAVGTPKKAAIIGDQPQQKNIENPKKDQEVAEEPKKAIQEPRQTVQKPKKADEVVEKPVEADGNSEGKEKR